MNDHDTGTPADSTFPQLDVDPETMHRHLMRARRLRAEAATDLLAHIGRIALSAFRRPLGTRSPGTNEAGRRLDAGAPETDLLCRYGWSERPALRP